jgi:MFS family permease
LPAGIWALGLGSLFMDTSSELIHSLLPIFMVTVLGGSMVTIGLVEGVAEATAAVTKVFSGALSDYFGKRKFLMVSGYALAALTKPIFPLANSMGWVFAARFVDRVGKGIRGAPRDALVADIAPPRLRGAAYGLRQALDSVGAFLGPMAALAMMAWFANDIRAAMWVAVVPAFITVAILIIGVREPGRAEVGVSEVARSTPPAGATAAAKAPKAPLSLADAKRLPLSFWIVVLLGTQLSLARFSEAFLVLRAQNVGLAIGYVPLIMIVMNVAYAGFAYPAGAAADRLPRRALLLAGLALLVAADLVLAAAVSPLTAFAGAALWGLHMAFTQGLFAKLVADTAPPDLRATAFGVFNLISGVALLLASVIAGALWTAFGPPTTFLAGAALATAAAIGLLAYHAGPQSR